MSNSQFSTLNSQLSKLAVFASGSGSNFEAIAQACVDGRVPAKIVLLVCDNANAYAIERAKKFDIPTLVLHPRVLTVTLRLTTRRFGLPCRIYAHRGRNALQCL